MATRPCIVIPGILGSSLEDFYPLSPEVSWSAEALVKSKLMAPDFDALALDDNADADSTEDVLTRPSALLGAAYGPLVSGLRGRSGVPTYVFAYDWRYSNVVNARRLVRFVQRLQRKPMDSLKPWDGSFDFAVHSMGGLILRAFFDEWQKIGSGALPVGQAVFIATPHLGALDAVEALISGEAVMLGGRKELRKLLRTFPSAYELLPRFNNAVVAGGAGLDIFDENTWQKNVMQAVQGPDDYGVIQNHLTNAKAVLSALPQPTDVIPAANLLVIYGANPSSTTVSVSVDPAKDNWYDFDNAQKGDGDDVVPAVSALLNGVAAVEIRTADVSYFHPIARGLASLDLHAFLPALDEVATVVSRFLSGKQGTDLLPKGIPGTRYHP